MLVLALFIGEISHVSLLANLLTTPAVVLVTIAGSFTAVAAALHPSWLVGVLLWCAAPPTQWIHQVARLTAGIIVFATGTVTLVVSYALMFTCLMTFWAWLRLASRARAYAAVLVTGSYVVIWVLDLDIVRTPQGWQLAACAEKSQVVLIRTGAGGEPISHAASTGHPVPTPLSRQYRISFGLTE